MRIAYCEDEKVQAVFLKELVEEWETKSKERCSINLYTSAEQMLFEHSDFFPFDFIILDIELDQMNGIELARNIRKIDTKVTIAFLSNSREYVFDGYEVAAIRYLMKPITKEQLFPLLDMILHNATKKKEYLIVGFEGEKIKLELSDILYVEAFGHYVSIITSKQTFETKMNMKEIAQELNNSFIATHRSYIVNLGYIEKITKTECILKDGQQIPISRNSYKSVNEAFIAYYKGGALS